LSGAFKNDPKQFLEPAATVAPPPAAGAAFVCPMDTEVRSSQPGVCPKCGMALEPNLSDPAALTKVEYTCPMHPQIVRDAPGSCPICGMALEPRTVSALDTPSPELVDMTRRFWIAALLAAPVFAVTMADMAGGGRLVMTHGTLMNWMASRSRRRSCSAPDGHSSSEPGRRS